MCEKHLIFAECAGIAELADDQRAIIEQLVLRLLPSESETPGLTDLIELNTISMYKVRPSLGIR